MLIMVANNCVIDAISEVLNLDSVFFSGQYKFVITILQINIWG